MQACDSMHDRGDAEDSRGGVGRCKDYMLCPADPQAGPAYSGVSTHHNEVHAVVAEQSDIACSNLLKSKGRSNASDSRQWYGMRSVCASVDTVLTLGVLLGYLLCVVADAVLPMSYV